MIGISGLFSCHSPLLSALQSVPQMKLGLCNSETSYLLFLPPGSLPLPRQCWQLVLVLQIQVWYISQNKMGYAVVTSNPQISTAYTTETYALLMLSDGRCSS